MVAVRILAFSGMIFFAYNAIVHAANQDSPQLVEYAKKLAEVDKSDAKELKKLAKWCKKQRLSRQEKEVEGLITEAEYQEKYAKLKDKPSPDGYSKLIKWCKKEKLAGKAEVLETEALVAEYETRKNALPENDATARLELLKWCEKNSLSAQMSELGAKILETDPEQPDARKALGYVVKLDDKWLKADDVALQYCAMEKEQQDEYLKQLKDAGYSPAKEVLDPFTQWLKSPTGLLQKQKTPGYDQETAWHHVYVSKHYDPKKSGLPLFIYLHGGAKGAGTAENIVALHQVIPLFQKSIALFPNHINTWWSAPTETEYVLDTIREVMRRWRVDRTRIYIMGSSMGGHGAWHFACRFPEMFAGCSPSAAWWEPLPIEGAAGLPIFIIHGSKDTTVPVEWGRKADQKMKALGANYEYHELDCGHMPPNDIFIKAAEWLYQFTNKNEFNFKDLKEKAKKLPTASWM